jgi:hypothetical protein
MAGDWNVSVSMEQDIDMTSTDLSNHKVVSLNEWLEARKELLIREKELEFI